MHKAVPLLLLIAIGYLLRSKFQQPAEAGAIKTLIVNAALPATILLSILAIDTRLNLFALPSFAIVINLYLLAISAGLAKLVFSNQEQARSRALMLMFPSLSPGLTAYPFIEEFLGKSGLAWASMADLGNKVFVLIGLYVLALYWQQQATRQVGNIRQQLSTIGLTLLTEPANLAIFVGLLLVSVDYRMAQLPTVVLEVLQKLAACSTPLILFFVGISLKPKLAEIRLVILLLLARAMAGFGFSAVAIACLRPDSAATATLMVILPQMGCSLWPLLYATQMNWRTVQGDQPEVFDTEFALGLLSASIPFSIGVVLLIFSGGAFWINPWHLGGVSLSLGIGLTLVLIVSTWLPSLPLNKKVMKKRY